MELAQYRSHMESLVEEHTTQLAEAHRALQGEVVALEEAHAEQEATIRLQELINRATSTRELMHLVTDYFRNWLKCDAVGIRLREGEDFPYYETKGFSESFVLAENSLCATDSKGELVRDSTGNPVLECMCGNIVCGRFDPSKPFFTDRGSFWTNSTTAVLANTTEADRQARTRDRCNGEGYESVGLFPLRVGTETYGLLQINAKRMGLFSTARVACLERLGAFLAVALSQRRTEEALRESEERFRAIADYTYDWEDWFDAEGKLIWINSAVERITGYSPEECLAMPDYPFPLIHEEDMVGITDTFQTAVREKTSGNDLPFRIRRKDGGIVWVAVSWQPIFSLEGKHLGMRASLRNITDRQKAEEALADYRDHLEQLVEERSRQLEESRTQLNRAQRLASVGTLAAGIAHEINNPLGLILMSAQRALEKSGDPTAVETSLHRIKNDVKRCAHIVKSVLQFSREESSDKWSTDVNQCVRHSEEFTREYANRHGVKVQFERAGVLPTVCANATELEQAFVNLLHNAVEACSVGQTVMLRTERSPTGVRITVADQGRGMATEEREHAFDPFYTTRQQRGGTGLGLSIVHGIITEQGGTIDIDSQPGKGTRVIIELPVEVRENSKE